jgi:hypothetical protein
MIGLTQEQFNAMKIEKPAYSDKNPKIDLYVCGRYGGSTNWSRTIKQAIANYYIKNKKHGFSLSDIKAEFSN